VTPARPMAPIVASEAPPCLTDSESVHDQRRHQAHRQAELLNDGGHIVEERADSDHRPSPLSIAALNRRLKSEPTIESRERRSRCSGSLTRAATARTKLVGAQRMLVDADLLTILKPQAPRAVRAAKAPDSHQRG